MIFKEVPCGTWIQVAETGVIGCKVAMLNGANLFDLTNRKLAYVEPLDKVLKSQPAIHPGLKHEVAPSLRTIRLWGDHTWTED